MYQMQPVNLPAVVLNSREGAMRIVHSLPAIPEGCASVSYDFKGRDITINFRYLGDEVDRAGRLRVELFLDICIESENQRGAKLPESSDTIYEIDARRDGFRKFVVWFSNNDVVTVECLKLYADNKEL